MRSDLLAQWRADIVGEWRAELEGVDLLFLEPVAGGAALLLVLRPDGTADYGPPTTAAVPSEPEPPFAIRWELSDDRILSVWLPTAPMPEYGMPDWSREQVCYDVLAVTDLSLAVSNRRFDGEQVVVFRRTDAEEYNRRKAAEYGRLLGTMEQWAKRG